MINGWYLGVSRHVVHLVMKVAGDSRVYKRRTISQRPPQCRSRCRSSPVSFARAPVRELFATRADYCHLLAFDEHRRREYCRLDRMSPSSFLGNSVTFLLTPLRADIWDSLTCTQGWLCNLNAHVIRIFKINFSPENFTI